jgi:hypothetical protein
VNNGLKRGFRIAAVAAAAALVAGSAVAIAGAAGGKGRARAVVKRHVVKRVVRAGVHADVSLVRADGSTDAFSVDRGSVTAASGTSVTLLRRDGKSVAISLNSSTRVRGTITTGRPALVFSRSGVAFRVAAPGPRTMLGAAAAAGVKPAKVVHLQVSFVRADGSTGSATLDRGQVTASSSTSLTVKRPDGNSVTLAVNATTRVRGKLVVGGKALVLSRNGTAVAVLARAAGA